MITQYRVGKQHRMPYLDRSLSAKEIYNLWLFAERDLQFKSSYASSPLCSKMWFSSRRNCCPRTQHTHTHTQTCTHTYTHTHAHTYTNGSMYAREYVRICLQVSRKTRTLCLGSRCNARNKYMWVQTTQSKRCRLCRLNNPHVYIKDLTLSHRPHCICFGLICTCGLHASHHRILRCSLSTTITMVAKAVSLGCLYYPWADAW